MILFAIFCIVVVLFAYLADAFKSDYYLKLSFFIIFIFLALRYEYGNDYISYMDLFYKIDHLDIGSHIEVGWQLLCLLFKPFGFFVMVAALALIQCVVYYGFIKKYVPSRYYSLALFLYLFTPTCFLILSSAMRQSVSVMIFVFAIRYIYEKDIIRYFISIIIAMMFHASAIVLFPVYFLGVFNVMINRTVAVLLFIIYPLMYLVLQYLQIHLGEVVSLYFRDYEMYLDAEMSSFGTGLGFIFNLFVLSLIITKHGLQNKENKLIYKLAILSYYVMPFSYINPMAGRIGMYFLPVLIVAFTSVLINVKGGVVRHSIAAVYSFIAIIAFYKFFESDIWAEGFGVYKTILSANGIY
jgi:transmembrane protein EpsG